jgi:hypothetical protein
MAAKTELPSLRLQRKTYAQTLDKARRENPVSTKAEYADEKSLLFHEQEEHR